MGKGDNLRWFLAVVDGKCDIVIGGIVVVANGQVDKPQVGVSVTPTGEDGSSGVFDGDRGVGEDCRASGVTELAEIDVRAIGLHLTSETLGLGTGCLGMLGSPRLQLATGGVVSTGAGGSLGVATAAAAKTRGLKIGFSLFKRRMVLLPPNMLLKVAAGL
jgi:hypothetical protein